MTIVSACTSPLYPPHFTSASQADGSHELPSDALSDSNVIQRLEEALKTKDLDLVEKCCEFIRQELNIHIVYFAKPRPVHLIIFLTHPSEAVLKEELTKYLDELTGLFQEKLLAIKFQIVDLDEEIYALIKNYGKFIIQLNINSGQTWKDGGIARILEFCPNLLNLWVTGPVVADLDLLHLNRLEKLYHLELNSCPRLTKLPDLSECKSLGGINITKCPITQFPSIAGHPALMTIIIEDCHQLENYPNFMGCTRLRDVRLHKCSNIKGRPIFYGCEKLYSLQIDRCPLNEQVDLNDCVELVTFDFGQDVKAVPLFSSCPILADVGFKGSSINDTLVFGRHRLLNRVNFTECQELSQAARIASFKTLIKSNPNIGLKFLNQFGISDPAPVHEVIFESTTPPYDFYSLYANLNLIDNIATQQFRMNFLEHLVRNHPKTALKNHLFFGIEDQNYIIDLFKDTEVVKEFTNDPSFRIRDPKNLVLYCCYLQMVRDNDFPERLPFAGAYFPLYDEIEMNAENLRQLNQFFYRFYGPVYHWKGLINFFGNRRIVRLSIEDRFSAMVQHVTPLFEVLEVVVAIGDTALTKKILSSEHYSNPKNGRKAAAAKSKALLRASKNRDADTSLYLLQQGAEAQYVGGTHDHQTPLSEARIHAEAMAKCLPYLEEADNGFTDEVIEALILAHKYGISGTREMRIGNKEPEAEAAQIKFLRTGFRPRYIVIDYSRRSRSFYDRLKIEMAEMQGELFSRLSPEVQHLVRGLEDSVRARIIDSLDIAFDGVRGSLDYEGADIDADDGYLKNHFLSRLDEGKPLSLFGVTRTNDKDKYGLHAWGFVIFKIPGSERYSVYYCNRGYGCDKYSGSVAIQMDEMEMLKLVSSYQAFSRWKTASNAQSDKFIKTVIQRFANENDKILLKSREQRCSNCCYTSLQAIELSLLHGLFTQIIGHEPAVLLAKGIKSLRSTEGRIGTLRDYLQRHSSLVRPNYPPDVKLIDEILERAQLKDSPKFIPIIEMIKRFNP